MASLVAVIGLAGPGQPTWLASIDAASIDGASIDCGESLAFKESLAKLEICTACVDQEKYSSHSRPSGAWGCDHVTPPEDSMDSAWDVGPTQLVANRSGRF